MDKRFMRVGNYVQDPIQNIVLEAKADEVVYADLFAGIPLTEKFFTRNKFVLESVNGENHYYREEGFFATAQRTDDAWFVQVRANGMTFTGGIAFVHQFQNILCDMGILMRIRL